MPEIDRIDLLWLVAMIWLGLGMAHDDLGLKIYAVAGLVLTMYLRDKERRKRATAERTDT